MPSASIVASSPLAATIAHVRVRAGDVVAAGEVLLFVEIMKMEHPVPAPAAGTVTQIHVAVGEQVQVGQSLVTLERAAPARSDPDVNLDGGDEEPDAVRDDLAEVHRRRHLLTDAARPDAVAARHARGSRTARENIADLLDAGSFSEYGGLAIAAQRGRRDEVDLQANTPADGLVTGTGTIDGRPVAVMAYDYTVLAGTQGHANHLKKDRLLRLALDHRLPLVVFAEGGGGRPGDVDAMGGSWLEGPTFRLFAQLSGLVPTVAVVHGRCYAGNAALAGCADVLIATRDSNLGMAGPAMIEGGGLGRVSPEEIGPPAVQVPNGVIDVLVADEAAAVAVARGLIGLLADGTAPSGASSGGDQTPLRDVIPRNRKRPYEVRSAIVDVLFDRSSVVELRPSFGEGMLTALARLGGRAVGVLANVATHLGGAIDAVGADKAARHLQLCDAHGLPLVVLCDTPGFMVGPQAEHDAGVRRFSRMFVAGAHLRVPILCVVTRKAYGLGAMAMMGGHLRVPALIVAWPTGELGPMGLEGAVRLGFRKELEATPDAAEREALEQRLVDAAYVNAAALNVATYVDIDDVIDPADTRGRLLQALEMIGPLAPPAERRFVDPR